MTKQQIIDQLKQEAHCFDAYWDNIESVNLTLTNDKIFCSKCNTLLGQFNYTTASWEII